MTNGWQAALIGLFHCLALTGSVRWGRAHDAPSSGPGQRLEPALYVDVTLGTVSAAQEAVPGREGRGDGVIMDRNPSQGKVGSIKENQEMGEAGRPQRLLPQHVKP